MYDGDWLHECLIRAQRHDNVNIGHKNTHEQSHKLMCWLGCDNRNELILLDSEGGWDWWGWWCCKGGVCNCSTRKYSIFPENIPTKDIYCSSVVFLTMPFYTNTKYHNILYANIESKGPSFICLTTRACLYLVPSLLPPSFSGLSCLFQP